MRVIDRLFEYLKHRDLTPYNVEQACGIANGYLKKQTKGKGTIGSENLEKIIAAFPDLNVKWLISGKGKMLVDNYSQIDQRLQEEMKSYSAFEQTIALLRDKIEILEKSLADKDKIIRLLEAKDSP